MDYKYIEKICTTIPTKYEKEIKKYKIDKQCEIPKSLQEDANVIKGLMELIGLSGEIMSKLNLTQLTELAEVQPELRLALASGADGQSLIDVIKAKLPKVKKSESSYFDGILHLQNNVNKVLPLALRKYLLGDFYPADIVYILGTVINIDGNIQLLSLKEEYKEDFEKVLAYCQYKGITFKTLINDILGNYVAVDHFNSEGICLLPHYQMNNLLLRTIEGYIIQLSTDQFKLLYEGNYLSKITFKDVAGIIVPYIKDDTLIEPVPLKSLLNPHLRFVTAEINPMVMIVNDGK